MAEWKKTVLAGLMGVAGLTVLWGCQGALESPKEDSDQPAARLNTPFGDVADPRGQETNPEMRQRMGEKRDAIVQGLGSSGAGNENSNDNSDNDNDNSGNDNGGNDNGGNDNSGNDNGGNDNSGNDNGGNDNGGNDNSGNGNDNGNTNTNGNGNGNENGNGNGNDNGNGDLCPDGSFRVETDLFIGGMETGDMRYREKVGGCFDFRARVDDFFPGTYDVVVSGMVVGQIFVGGNGDGELEYDTEDGTFPDWFPMVMVGDMGSVGDASGVFALDCSEDPDTCNANGNGNTNGNTNGNGNTGNDNTGNGNTGNDNGNANG